jgi:hypothetical protein
MAKRDGAARRALRETADAAVDKLTAFYLRALEAEKQVWITCSGCKGGSGA